MNELTNLISKLDKVTELVEDNKKNKEDISKLIGSTQIINTELHRMRNESQAGQLQQFMNHINTRVNAELEKVTKFFVDIKKRVFPIDITPDMLRDLMARTGVKQKELADVLGYSVDDLAAISRVISGERNDPYKRWLVYNYCNAKLVDILKSDKTEVKL